MKKLLLAASLFYCGFTHAATPIDGLYLAVFGGYNYLPNTLDVKVKKTLRSSPSYNNGWNTGLRLGYQIHPWRYELEYMYLRADLKHFKLDGIRQTGVKGHTEASFAMANVYVDLPDMVPDIAPFLGFGIGYAHLNGKFNSSGPLLASRYSPSNSEFAFQGTTGLTYNFAENYAISLAYRYISTTKANSFGKSFEAHTANVAVLYRFDYARYK